MDGIAAEVGQKLKSAIKAKLMELGAYVDDELSNYVMVMVTNRRSKAEMDRELQLFLGGNTSVFTSWLQSVWQKLEQVTIANSGIEAHKRKLTDKKKKMKKMSKSSSESEDDKKHRKKRKYSVSTSNCKDIKKLKRFDAMVDIKKVKRSGLNLHSETDSEDDEQAGNYANLPKKSVRGVSPGSSIDEDEFLNIKDDFESAFLSDVEFPEASNKGKTLIDHPKTPMVNVTVKRIKDSTTTANRIVLNDENVDNNVVKKVAGKINTAEMGHSVEIKAKTVSKRKPLIRDFKGCSPTKASKLPKHSGISPPFKTRSRSSSSSQTDNVQLRRKHSASLEQESANEESNVKSESSRLKPATVIDSSIADGSQSPRRSRSPLRNVNSKRMPIREESPVVLDARELINRKRAASCINSDISSLKQGSLLKRLSHIADPSSIKAASGGDGKQKNNLGMGKTTVSGGKIIRLRDLKRSKENCLVNSEENMIVEHDSEWNKADENAAGDSATATLKELQTFVVNKSDDKRNVIVQSSAPTLDSPKIVLREIKRTVFIEDGIDQKYDRNATLNSEMEESIVCVNDETKTIRKMRRAGESIKPKRVVSSAVVKLQKPPRSKTLTAQSASSTLIRKAMADAHKSLSTSKDESHKKRELADAKGLTCQEISVATTHGHISEDEETPHPEEAQYDDSYGRLSTKSVTCSDNGSVVKSDEEKNRNKSDEQTVEAEEYDPSQNMPQFVVTLTGLDPKLYPVQDTDEIMDNLNDEFDSVIEEGIKSKPKMQERCKYYPNCLAGDQCLFYHPTIHCKLFPNCKYGNSCLYIHPKCKFDSMCTRYDCTFFHTTSRITASVSVRHSAAPTTMNAQPCKYYYNCVNPVCTFQHPKICRFDRFCTNKNCTFSHTSLSHVSAISKDKLKWSRPKDTDTSERAPKLEKDTSMPIDDCQ